MTSSAVDEFRESWLPHMTNQGVARLIDLLASASPFLIHGAFERAMPMGCLASQIAWNHPATAHLLDEAGICWLTRIAGLNPATSRVILRWDENGIHDLELREDLLTACREEMESRRTTYGVCCHVE